MRADCRYEERSRTFVLQVPNNGEMRIFSACGIKCVQIAVMRNAVVRLYFKFRIMVRCAHLIPHLHYQAAVNINYLSCDVL
mgnify:CR=1 FL=1